MSVLVVLGGLLAVAILLVSVIDAASSRSRAQALPTRGWRGSSATGRHAGVLPVSSAAAGPSIPRYAARPAVPARRLWIVRPEPGEHHGGGAWAASLAPGRERFGLG
jgi:hypothetical protein